MTYTGAMVLPQNAVVLQEEEMRYLEGGAPKGSNQYYRKMQQKKLKIQMSKLSKAERKKVEKLAWDYQLGYISMAMSGLSSIVGGTVFKIVSWGASSVTVLRTCR